MHVKQIRVGHILTNPAVMPSGGFLIYFCLTSSMNFGSIASLLSVAIFSMEQTEDKINRYSSKDNAQNQKNLCVNFTA